jgi:dihydroxyacetone synthase
MYFLSLAPRGKQLESEWSNTLSAYEKAYPELAAEFKLHVAGKMPEDWTKFIHKKEDLLKEASMSALSIDLIIFRPRSRAPITRPSQ